MKNVVIQFTEPLDNYRIATVFQSVGAALNAFLLNVNVRVLGTLTASIDPENPADPPVLLEFTDTEDGMVVRVLSTEAAGDHCI